MRTWREMIDIVRGEEELIECTLTEEEMDIKFDTGFGGSEGLPFTAWTDTYVLFPVVYDGAEWVSKAPRNPCDEACQHCGGQ